MAYRHVPCMSEEVMAYLACSPGKIMVDGTIGGAGHSRLICRTIQPGGQLIAIDRDPDALRHAETELEPWLDNLHLINDTFANLPEILDGLGISQVHGILLDLGISRDQIETSGRGFSFQRDDPLDMRMDGRTGAPAEHLVNTLPEKELVGLFQDYGEERFARRIASAIVRDRQSQPISRSNQLAAIVKKAVPVNRRAKRSLHPATRVFMALRIAVNRELEHLDRFLARAQDCLKPGGRLCILSFHSLEDRRVKHRFRDMATGCTCPTSMPICQCQGRPVARLLTRRVVRPSEAEVQANPLARSTRLRAIEKL